MSCAKSSGGAGAEAGNPSSALELGSSSLTCSLKYDLGDASKISGGWIKKSIEGLGVTIEGIWGLSRKKKKKKKSNTMEVDREAQK